jgi:hypothetical protein
MGSRAASVIIHCLALMWSVVFPCLATRLSCVILSQAGLLEVPVTYLGSLGYFLTRVWCCRMATP